MYVQPTDYNSERELSTLRVEAQGSLLVVSPSGKKRERTGGGKRGIVTTFSNGSRKRLMRKMARISNGKAVFITLTYPERYPNPETSKKHLRAFLERMRRKFPMAAAVWRLEFQKRGAPHYHLICFGLPYFPFEQLRKVWAEIISDYVDETLPFVRIEMIRSKRGVMSYVSKYVAKESTNEYSGSDALDGDAPDGDAVGLFNDVSYLHDIQGIGRLWGIHNKKYMPFALKNEFETNFNGVMLNMFKRRMRREWKGVNREERKGATIFTDECYDILRLFDRYAKKREQKWNKLQQ